MMLSSFEFLNYIFVVFTSSTFALYFSFLTGFPKLILLENKYLKVVWFL